MVVNYLRAGFSKLSEGKRGQVLKKRFEPNGQLRNESFHVDRWNAQSVTVKMVTMITFEGNIELIKFFLQLLNCDLRSFVYEICTLQHPNYLCNCASKDFLQSKTEKNSS